MRTIVWTSLLFAASLLFASLSSAQTRSFPVAAGQRFVEQVDPGALCPTCQVILLQDADPPPTHVDVYGPAVPVRVKPVADLMIYEAATGNTLLVIGTPFGAQAPYATMGVWETYEWIQLRPGILWDKGDIDGDSRTDLAGHDKQTGDVIRLLRR